MTPESFKQLLERYSQGLCTDDESKLVEKWYESIDGDDRVVPQSAEHRIWKKISDEAAHADRKPLYLKIAASTAAIAMLSLAGFFTFNSPSREVQGENRALSSPLVPPGVDQLILNETGSPKDVSLEDGSIVRLHPRASLRIPTAFSSTERNVSLTGEAFFKIKRDTLRPFFVYSGEVVTKVLGTSFTIKALESDKKVTVSVKTGKVSVYANPRLKASRAPAVILTPNQQAVYSAEDIVVRKELVAKPEIVLDKPTLFSMKYESAPVPEILDVLQENYAVDIRFDRAMLKDCILTTSMSEEGLLERLEVICKAIGASYIIEDAVIYVTGKGCQ